MRPIHSLITPRTPSRLLALVALPTLLAAGPALADKTNNSLCAQRCTLEYNSCWDRCISNGGSTNDCSAGCNIWFSICMNNCDAVGPIDPWGDMYRVLQTGILAHDDVSALTARSELSSASLSLASKAASERINAYIVEVELLSEDEITAESRATLLLAAKDAREALLQPEGGCVNFFGEGEEPAGEVAPLRGNPITELAALTSEAEITSPDVVNEVLSILTAAQGDLDAGVEEAAVIGGEVASGLAEAMDRNDVEDVIRPVLEALVLDSTLDVKHAVACLPAATSTIGEYDMNADGANYNTPGVCQTAAWGHHALLWKYHANVAGLPGSYTVPTFPVPGQINRDVQCGGPSDAFTLNEFENGNLGVWYRDAGNFPLDPAGSWGCAETSSWNAAAGFIGMAMWAWDTPVYMDMVDAPPFDLAFTRYGVVRRIKMSVPGSSSPEVLCNWTAAGIPAMMARAELCTSVLTVLDADIGYWDENLVGGPGCAYDEATIAGSLLRDLFTDSLFLNGGEADFVADPPEGGVEGFLSTAEVMDTASAYAAELTGQNVRVEVQTKPPRD